MKAARRYYKAAVEVSRENRKPLCSTRRYLRRDRKIKTYCKNVDITDPVVIAPWIELYITDPDHRNRAGVKRLLTKYGDAHGIAVEITERIKARDLKLPPIQYHNRVDPSCGKLRRLGVESAIQQCMNYVAVYALMPMLKAKVGPFQCASIPGRGQVFGKKVLEKWIRKDPKGTKYYDKMDVRHCFESISCRTIRRLLERDIRKNPTLIWFVTTLVGSYEEGLSIGSFLSQWLCNYVMSYLYHYAAEMLYKERRGQRKNLITHILMFMDDVIIFGSSKRDVKLASKAIEEYMLNQLGLQIKPNHNIKETAKEPPDMMGFVVAPECTTIRARTFVRARRALIRAWDRMQKGLPILLQNARRIISYRGYFLHTNSQTVAKALHLKEVCRAARKIISKFAKGAHQNGNESILHGTPGGTPVYALAGCGGC